jgi:hypothetical protein
MRTREVPSQWVGDAITTACDPHSKRRYPPDRRASDKTCFRIDKHTNQNVACQAKNDVKYDHYPAISADPITKLNTIACHTRTQSSATTTANNTATTAIIVCVIIG